MKRQEMGEIITKYRLRVDGVNIACGIKPPQDVIERIKANKARMITEMTERAAERQAAAEKTQSEYKAKQDAVDAPCIAAMDAEVMRLRAKIPAGAIEVEAAKVGAADGYTICEYRAQGVVLPITAITMVGWASAIRPGALGAFREKGIFYTSAAAIAEEKAKKEKKTAEKLEKEQAEKSRIEALTAEATATGQKRLLRKWMTDRCMRRGEDCSFDIAGEYVFPDGTIKTEYVCCY